MGKSSINAAAQQILRIVEDGSYEADGSAVEVSEMLAASIEGTRLYLPDELAVLRGQIPSPRFERTAVTVPAQTTQQAAQELHGPATAILNFASARNPGGGFLGGARAQEEEVCRCSGLYPTLLTQPEYYDFHRGHRSLLYSDRIIYSPDVPFFRISAKAAYLPPFTVSVLTAPAPNAGAMEQRNLVDEATRIPSVFARRWENLLALAASERMETLVLGAWGCGAFRNDAESVAETALAAVERYRGVFRTIAFAIPATGKGRRSRENLEAFRRVFGANDAGQIATGSASPT